MLNELIIQQQQKDTGKMSKIADSAAARRRDIGFDSEGSNGLHNGFSFPPLRGEEDVASP